jgi:hypothetical protein
MGFFLNSFVFNPVVSNIPCNNLILVAEYLFQDNLQSTDNSLPNLINVNPLGTNNFKTSTLFGVTRQIFEFNGNTSFAQNAGLTLNTSLTNLSSDDYTIELVFRFFGSSGWRKITDHQNRISDSGFYISPSSQFQIYPVVSGPSTFIANQWYHVFLSNYTKNGINLVKLYNNNNLEFDVPTSQLNLNNSNNPNKLLHFFLDDSAVSGEYSSGQVALIRVYNHAACDTSKLPSLQLNSIIPPTYSITPSSLSVNENSSVTFTVSTTFVPNGTILYWTTQQISGIINSADFTDGLLNGTTTINNNIGSIITRTLTNDTTTEGTESFAIQLRTGSLSGPIVAVSDTVTINDTSTSGGVNSATARGLVGWDYGNGRVATVSNVAGIEDLNDPYYALLIKNTCSWLTRRGQPGYPTTPNILILTSGNTTYNTQLKNTLENPLWFNATISTTPWYNFTGTDINSYDLVLLTGNYNWNSGSNIPSSGQTAIVNFVNNGGALFTFEWMIWRLAVSSAQHTIIDPIIPVVVSSSYNNRSKLRFKKITEETTINNGIPDEFQWEPVGNIAGTETDIIAVKPGAITFYDSIPAV